MAEKALNIVISADDLTALKTSGYSLCLAKKVKDYEFNVAWHVYEKFLANNKFTWTPTYQLFASNNFKPDTVVSESVTPVGIELGQQTTLDENGALSSPKSGGAPTALTMRNDFGPIHPGINQTSGGLDRTLTIAPIFLTEKPVLKGVTELTPMELIMVWFEQGIQTGSMFNRLPPVQGAKAKTSMFLSRTFAIVIDFSLDNEKTVSYKNQEWFNGSLSP